MDGLLNTLKFVHKMCEDIKFVCSSVQNWSIKCGCSFYRFLWWFISRRCWLPKHKLDVSL